MSLAELSEARKARLLALRRRARGEAPESEEPNVQPRNFDPETRTLRKRTAQDDMELEDTVENKIRGLAEAVLAEDEERREQDLDLLNIAPKRANWDLKRDMDRKMAKLERRTQEAIHTLIRQRLAAQKGESDDIVGALRAQEKGGVPDDDASDED